MEVDDLGSAVPRLASDPIVGRERELEQLGRLVDGIGARGGAVVVRGEAGIGKSALLHAVEQRALARGAIVTTLVGTPSEGRFAFGAVHQLLRPFLDAAETLPAPQRRALEVALGVSEGPAPEVFLVGLATLGVLTETATRTPVVLVVDDAHWLDGSSAEVLGFVARRLEMEGVLVVLAVRTGLGSHLADAGLPELLLTGLDEASSRAVLSVNGSGLPPELQERILAEAVGNPLALIELPIAAGALHSTAPGKPLPLTGRLEAAFAARLADLADDVRALLLCAALDGGELATLTRAAHALAGSPIDVTGWTTAVEAGLGTLDGDRFRFRHPLIRSAVRQGASEQQRRRAHAAIATVLADSPDLAVWHRAAAAADADDTVAADLVATGRRAAARGGIDAALDAFERAAHLTSDPRLRALRLYHAAELDVEAGTGERTPALLREALRTGLPSHEAVRASFVLETMSTAWSGTSAVPRFAEIAQQLAASGNDHNALDTIATVGMRAFLGPLSDDVRRDLSEIVVGLAVPPAHPQRLATLALLDPVGRGREVVQRLRDLSPVTLTAAHGLTWAGEAASAVWADDLALPFLQSAIDRLRPEGRLVWLAQALTLHAWVNARQGAVREAITSADEAARLAAETRQPRYVPVANLAHAAAAGGMGEEEIAHRLVAEAEAALLPMGAHPLLALVAVVRGRTALAAERPAEAYTELIRIFTPGDTAHQPFVGGWALADLTEAAVHGGGDLDRVAGILGTWQQTASTTGASHLHVQLTYAKALLAEDAAAEQDFSDAMAGGSEGWPFYAARARLSFGQRLRRQHRDTDARPHLRQSAQLFEGLGQRRYADRALRELRATGERARARSAETWTDLSPQELQIAQLAAEGLTNREIGGRLYLSHRTIGTHLYNLFPKLGITSRSQLRDALGPPSADPTSG